MCYSRSSDCKGHNGLMPRGISASNRCVLCLHFIYLDDQVGTDHHADLRAPGRSLCGEKKWMMLSGIQIVLLRCGETFRAGGSNQERNQWWWLIMRVTYEPWHKQWGIVLWQHQNTKTAILVAPNFAETQASARGPRSDCCALAIPQGQLERCNAPRLHEMVSQRR